MIPVISLIEYFVKIIIFFHSSPSFTARLKDVNNKGNIKRWPKGCTPWLKVSDQQDLVQFSDFGVSPFNRV